MKTKSKVILFACIGILVLATLFVTFVYNPNGYETTSNYGKCYMVIDPDTYFKPELNMFPIWREVNLVYKEVELNGNS
jgi:hypothetical protein